MLKVKRCYLISLIIIIIFSIIPIEKVNAHSVLEESSPVDGEQLEDSIESIELIFNTKIENGSTLSLVDTAGNEIQPNSVEIRDNILEARFQEMLKPDTYQVIWKIIGADGHPIENTYSFTIMESDTKLSEDNATQKEDEEIKNTTENEISQSDKEKEDGTDNQDTEEQNSFTQDKSNESNQASLETGIIIFLIVSGVVLLAWMLFSKRKK